MPWLVVLGSGSWTPGPGMRYRAGKHYVTEEVAAKARALGRRTLIVVDEEPEIVRGVGPGPLTPEDVRFGTTAGVRFKEQELVEELEAEYEIPLTYECQWCPEKRPSQAALDRHHKVKHPEFVGG